MSTRISRLASVAVLTLTFTALGGCASEELALAGGGDETGAVGAPEKEGTLWVGKSDQSRQCEPESGVSHEVLAEELTSAGVEILAQTKGMDGRIYIQVCGNPTGKIYLFAIPARQEEKALAQGFEIYSH